MLHRHLGGAEPTPPSPALLAHLQKNLRLAGEGLIDRHRSAASALKESLPESGWGVRIANLLATVAAHVGRCLQSGQDGCAGLGIKQRPLTSQKSLESVQSGVGIAIAGYRERL